MAYVPLPVAFGEEGDTATDQWEAAEMRAHRQGRSSADNLDVSIYAAAVDAICVEWGWEFPRTPSLEIRRQAATEYVRRLRAKEVQPMTRENKGKVWGDACQMCGQSAPLRVSDLGILVGECCARSEQAKAMFELVRVMPETEDEEE